MVNPEDFGAVKFSLTNARWQYRGEGNANIIISLPMERRVLRILKSNKLEILCDLDLWHRLQLNVKFIATIMRSLLGPMFVSPPSLVYLTKKEIDHLNRTILTLRPENRRHKELLFGGAELCDDHAFLPSDISTLCLPKTLSIEIKPKQGVFSTFEMRQKSCAFCRKQELKLVAGQVSERSQYCPLDLFSGEHSRMEHAVKSLIHSPQNNLRVFCDGNLVYGEGISITDFLKVLDEWLGAIPGMDPVQRFACLMVQSLTLEFNPSLFNDSSDSWRYDGVPQCNEKSQGGINIESLPPMSQSSCNYEKMELSQGCILHRLAQAQALDVWGNTFVHRMLTDKISSFSKEVVTEDVLKSTSANFNYVTDIMRKGFSSKLNPIELYLIAAAVRDCSILVSFQILKEKVDHTKICELPHVIDDASKQIFVLKIAAVDLDPKPLSCIASHLKRDAAILKICERSVSEHV